MIYPAPFEPWRGAFETLAVRSGRPQFVAAHAQELRRACAALGLGCDFDAQAAAAALPAGAEGRWRWIATASGVIHFFTSEAPRAAARRYPLVLARTRVGSANLDARFKTLSYLTHAQAAAECPEGEAVLLNEHGQVASAARANLFWWQGDRLCTPAVECGCRAGVVRGWVLEHATVTEVAEGPDALEAADEIFVTNSLRGLQSVTHWQGRPLGPAPRTARLRRRFRPDRE
ncbi:MAG: aminotransferase class IV [Verrucomicrobia bacterium]|nr:aminotransferase class IV [Verrucomicrobiota bacterium]